MPGIDYSAVTKLEFTDDDTAQVIAAEDTSGLKDGKVLASLSLDNFPAAAVDPAILTEFAKLAAVLKLPVSKAYGGLEIKRELTAAEKVLIAVDALRYGYGNTATAIRDQRAAEQGISIYKPE